MKALGETLTFSPEKTSSIRPKVSWLDGNLTVEVDIAVFVDKLLAYLPTQDYAGSRYDEVAGIDETLGHQVSSWT
jgi:hypothetical protein